MGLFTTKEAGALAPPLKLSPSAWAEEYRYLPSSVAAEPGKYRGARTPYIAGIIDAIQEPWLEELVIIKAAQLGFTTAIQNLIAWAVDQEPAPALLVMPSQDESRKIVKEQLQPLVENTPRLLAHLADDAWAVTADTILFDSMPIYLGWAGSPQSLARRACRYVFLDEVDKYPSFSGRDAAPIPLARKRTSTYLHRARIVIGSTPTKPDGAIAQAYAGCGDRRQYHVPCPHCQEHQVLVFSQIRFDSAEVKAIDDRAKRADFILTTTAAHYECCHCCGVILDRHKPAMLTRGQWLSENQRIDKAGVITGERPKAKRVGFQISGIYSPWVSFSAMAAQFVRSIGDSGAMMEFRNQWLGEVFEDIDNIGKSPDLSEIVVTSPDAGRIPKWAGVVVATADVHEHRIDFVLRAHGRDDRSQLIHEGDVPTFDDLTSLCLNSSFQIEGCDDILKPFIMFVDAGYRTNEVYAFSQTDARIKPTLGARDYNPKSLLVWSVPSKELGVNVGTIHTQYYKDKLATLRKSGKWLINKMASAEYLRQMASEHKVIDRESGKSIWKKVSAGAANHRFDCEVYQLAAADFIQANTMPDESALEAIRMANRKQREVVQQRPAQSSGWLGNTKKWL